MLMQLSFLLIEIKKNVRHADNYDFSLLLDTIIMNFIQHVFA